MEYGIEWQKKTGQISALASNQLSAWEDIAREELLVPVKLVTTDEDYQVHLTCARSNCTMSVYSIEMQTVSPSILLAATVAHLRNFHRELDPDA
jgi:hypothetical protein